MKFLRAAVQQVVHLFVLDWVQSGVVLAIILLAWFAVSRFGANAVVVLVVLLAAQLVWFASAAGRRKERV